MKDKEEEIISFEPEKTEKEKAARPCPNIETKAVQTEEEIISFEPEKTEEEKVAKPFPKPEGILKEKLKYLSSLKSLLYTFGGLIISLLVYDVSSTFYAMYQFNTLLSFIFLIIIISFSTSLYFFLKNQLNIVKSLKTAKLIQSQCNTKDKNYRKNLLALVEKFDPYQFFLDDIFGIMTMLKF